MNPFVKQADIYDSRLLNYAAALVPGAQSALGATRGSFADRPVRGAARATMGGLIGAALGGTAGAALGLAPAAIERAAQPGAFSEGTTNIPLAISGGLLGAALGLWTGSAEGSYWATRRYLRERARRARQLLLDQPAQHAQQLTQQAVQSVVPKVASRTDPLGHPHVLPGVRAQRTRARVRAALDSAVRHGYESGQQDGSNAVWQGGIGGATAGSLLGLAAAFALNNPRIGMADASWWGAGGGALLGGALGSVLSAQRARARAERAADTNLRRLRLAV